MDVIVDDAGILDGVFVLKSIIVDFAGVEDALRLLENVRHLRWR